MKMLSRLIQEYFSLEDKIEIKNVVMDSRKIEENSLFFAIQGGNQYVEEALAKGASLVVADAYPKDHSRVIKVENTIFTMQQLAQEYRKKLGLKVLAITGSNGKTTTKDICHSILSKKYQAKKTLGNYNNHIGLPFTILNLEEGDEFAVLELGMSSLGEIDLLGKISAPDYAIITNIGDSHLEFLKTRENVFKAKTELLSYVEAKNVITNGDDIFLKKVVAEHIGYDKENEHQIQGYQKEKEKTSFVLDGKEYHISLEGKHNVMNAAMAIVFAKKIGMMEEEIQKNIQQIELSPMRFQRILRGKTEYINDAYNASPISMAAALNSFEEITHPCKIVVLGDMLELGEEKICFHKQILEKAMKMNFSKIMIYGTLMEKAWESLGEEGKRIEYYSSKEEIKKEIQSISEKIVLLKGSRGMKLEEIIEGEK